jgi:hypothetical protein
MVATITSTLGQNPLAVIAGQCDERPLIATSEHTQAQLPTLRVGDKVVCDESWENQHNLIYLGKVYK